MEQLIERVCGLDVHKDTVAAGVRVPGPKGTRAQHVRTFGTTVADLLSLRDWLQAHGVTHVAMESTGVYWKPIYYILEEAFTCLLVHAAQDDRAAGLRAAGAELVVGDLLEPADVYRVVHVPDDRLPDEHPEHHPEPSAAAALAQRAELQSASLPLLITRQPNRLRADGPSPGPDAGAASIGAAPGGFLCAQHACRDGSLGVVRQ